MNHSLPALDDHGLEAALEFGTKPLVVDFWAPWCGPCRTAMPTFAQIAGEMADQAEFATVNVDENPALAGRYDVRSIPTVLVFSRGALVGRSIGAQSADQLRQLVGAGLR
ncbi:MAG: thioredoxin [Steroidobacteraceae bacterium]